MPTSINGRIISKGIGAGEALVCNVPIGFNFGVDTETGVITEHKHPLEGISIKDKVLIFPNGKGSTGGSYVVYQLAKMETGPCAILNLNTETIIAVGAIMGGIPVMDQLDGDLFALVEDGDHLVVDANKGTVTITKKGDTN